MVSQEHKHRFISFYLEDIGGHQVLEVKGSLEIKDFFGNKLGTFPLEKGEQYSWYLCGCGPDPFAWRVKGPTDFKCRVCRRPPKSLFVCSCGVVSPVRDDPHCLWCGRTPASESHSCREAGGLLVFHDIATCALCGQGAAPPVLDMVATVQPVPVTDSKTRPMSQKVENFPPSSMGTETFSKLSQYSDPPPPPTFRASRYQQSPGNSRQELSNLGWLQLSF